jgi:hypothetical protein
MRVRDLQRGFLFAGLALGSAALAVPAAAVTTYDDVVTNAVIFGAGNANGGFTVDRSNGVELGLRAKLRFDASNQPQNVYNSNGDGTYTFPAGQPVGGGFGFAPGSPSTAVWNFEWSINTNYDGSTSLFLDDLTYRIGIDFDPTVGTNFLAFDPIHVPVWDHSIGTNATASGAGVETNVPATYAALIASNNLAQNSWNIEFFDDAGAGFPFDANADGHYKFTLAAFDSSGAEVARTTIQIQNGAAPVPEPSATLLFAVSLAVAGRAVRRR